MIVWVHYWQLRKKEKNISDTSKLLDAVAKNLIRQKEDNERTFAEAIDKHNEVQQLLYNNKRVVNENIAILKKNSTELYHVRECSIWLYDHYTQILGLIDSNFGDKNEDRIVSARIEAMNGMHIVETYFTNTFGVHPKDYKKAKQNILGTRPNGGNNFLSESSIN